MLGKRLGGLGGALAACGLGEEGRRALEVAGLGGAFELFADRAAAVAGVAAAQAARSRRERVIDLAAQLLGAAPAGKKPAGKARP